MSLDAVAAVLCGLVCLGCFTLHVVSSPARGHWLTLPEYVRFGFLVTGAMFLWRAVNFASLVRAPQPLGHINAEGMMALIAMAYTITALAFYVVRRSLTPQARSRVDWVEAVERDNPELAPVMMAPRELTEAARARGIPAVGPQAGPGDLAEASRPPPALH